LSAFSPQQANTQFFLATNRNKEMFEPNRSTITLQTGPDDEDDYLPAEEAQKLLEVASRFRGDVINETVYIEDKLHKYLARYFRNDPKKSDELRKMTFEKKACAPWVHT
jgi:hypothetical protein